MDSKTIWLHLPFLVLTHCQPVKSEPFIQVSAAVRTAAIAKTKTPPINTSWGEGHHVLGRQHQPAHTVMNRCGITCRQVVRGTVTMRTL